MSCWTSAMVAGRKVTIDEYNGLYLIKEEHIERIFSDNTSINRFVVSQAILKCLQLIEDCYGKNSVLYSINTDGIFITNPKVHLKNKKDVKFKTNYIGRAYVTDSKLSYFEKHNRENLNFDDNKCEISKGCIFLGGPGCGKNYRLCGMISRCENPLVLSFTNKAIENVKDRLKKLFI